MNAKEKSMVPGETILTGAGIAALAESLPKPVSAAAAQMVRDKIDAQAELVKVANAGKLLREWEAAKAVTKSALGACEKHLRWHEEALREFAAVEPAHLLRIVIWGFCALICASAEFALTWETLPFILNVAKRTFLGVMLGAAPAAGVAVLEVGIAAVLAACSRVMLQQMDSSRLRKCAAWGLLALSIGLLIGGNVYTVRILADAREEVAKVRRNLERQDGEAEAEVNQGVIKEAIVAVSVAVTIDGAIFLMLLMEDFKRLDRRVKIGIRIALMRRREGRLHNALHQAEAEEKYREQRWGAREEFLKAVVEEYRQECLLELQRALDQKTARRSLAEVVNDIRSSGSAGIASVDLPSRIM